MPRKLIYLSNSTGITPEKIAEEWTRLQNEAAKSGGGELTAYPICRVPEMRPAYYQSGQESRRERRALERKIRKKQKLF